MTMKRKPISEDFMESSILRFSFFDMAPYRARNSANTTASVTCVRYNKAIMVENRARYFDVGISFLHIRKIVAISITKDTVPGAYHKPRIP